MVANATLAGWDTFDIVTGQVREPGHPLEGRSVKGMVLIVSGARGSTGWATQFLKLRLAGVGPIAMVFPRIDSRIGAACVVANVPVVTDLQEDIFAVVADGDLVRVDGDAGVVHVWRQDRGGEGLLDRKSVSREQRSTVVSNARGGADVVSALHGEPPKDLPMSATTPLERLQSAMVDDDVDLVVIGPSTSLRYALQLNHIPVALERLLVLLVTPGAAAMILPDFDVAEVAEATGLDGLFGYRDKVGHEQAVAEAFASLQDLPADPMTVIDEELSFRDLVRLRDRLGSRPPEQATLLNRLRLVKADDEQAALAAAGEMVSQALDVGLAEARPGMTEVELARVVESALWAAGADAIEVILIQAGANSAMPHHLPAETRLRRGEPVLIDIVASRDGYFSDITGQAFLGVPPDDYVWNYDVVHRAQRAGVAAARSGVSVDDIDRAASAPILEAGLGEWIGPRTGHGIGLDPHELPSVVEGSPFTLPEGSAITVEPGVYLPGRYGIRIEDVVVVGPDGPIVMTRGSRSLTIND